MKVLGILLILLIGALADDKFKETEKAESKGPGTPPTIAIPENLRVRVNISEAFNIAVGLDMVRHLFLILF